jgi:hypothetical protein
MNENQEITATMASTVLNMQYMKAYRRICKLRARKGLTERKPTVGEFCNFYKYDVNIFLNAKL